jgi:hypothetical protein
VFFTPTYTKLTEKPVFDRETQVESGTRDVKKYLARTHENTRVPIINDSKHKRCTVAVKRRVVGRHSIDRWCCHTFLSLTQQLLLSSCIEKDCRHAIAKKMQQSAALTWLNRAPATMADQSALAGQARCAHHHYGSMADQHDHALRDTPRSNLAACIIHKHLATCSMRTVCQYLMP